ncbi:MAG: hypothetical protein ACP5DZ_11280, partial [Bacteroidales bacterium]
NWNTAYSWGPHAGLYRPVSWLPDWDSVTNKPSFATVATSGSYSDLSNTPDLDSTNWNMAFSWGNHATAGYVTEEADPVWVDDSTNYYTKSMLQTPGQSQVHYDNLTNVPDIPSDLNELTDNDNILFDGDYNSLENIPTLNELNYWTKNGNRLYYIPGNNGQVGIGTSSPETSLEIHNGSLKISGNSSFHQETARLVVDAQLSTAHNLMELRNNNGIILKVLGNGNIGIGMNNPTAKLHIKHFPENDWSYGVKIDVDNAKTKAFAIRNYYADEEFVEIYRVMGNGTVIAQKQGIGTYSPKHLLHVHNNNYEIIKPDPVPGDVIIKDKSGDKGGLLPFGTINSSSTIQVTNYNTGKTENDGLLIQMHNKSASITNQENGSLTLLNNGMQLQLEQNGNLSVGDEQDAYFTVNEDGNVGIRTETPETSLEVYEGTLRISGGSSLGQDDARFVVDPGASYAHRLMELRNDQQGEILVVNGNGRVGIGTTNPQYKLDVCGDVHAKEIRINMVGCDYVFDEQYELMTINELENHIKRYNRLPNIPSAKALEAEAYPLGQLNSKLLEKIEELTLYIISQQKEINYLRKEIENLKK